jgi:hypothetical protein
MVIYHSNLVVGYSISVTYCLTMVISHLNYVIDDSFSVKYNINMMLIYLYTVGNDLDAVSIDFSERMGVVEDGAVLMEGR